MKRVSTRIAAAVLCGTATVGLVAANASASPADNTVLHQRRGELVSATVVAQLDSGQVAEYLKTHNLDASRVRFGVDAKRIVYRTIDPWGKPTTASGLVALPRNENRFPRQVAWLHGTMAPRAKAGSVSDEGNDRAASVFFASAGYLTTAPDYLGLGLGPGFQPFGDGPSTVSASQDALRAARELAGRDGRRPDPRILVTGHSEGGWATMALGQSLQRSTDPRFSLAGLAPISGPMHPSTFVNDVLAGKIEQGVAYLAFWTRAWNQLYHLYDSPAEAFRDPTIDALFDGSHSEKEIFSRLPATAQELFTTNYLSRIQRPTGVLRAALKEADSYCDWRPRVPVTLYTSTGDRSVLIDNSTYCRKQLEQHHSKATLIDLGPQVGHGDAFNVALPHVLAEFLKN